MNAIMMFSFGGPEVLRPGQIPAPTIGAGEVLIQVADAGVNPVDYKIRSGSFRRAATKLPAVPGRDVSGIVAEVGAGIRDLVPGDAVYAFLAAHSGGYADLAVAREEEVARKPASIDHEHAAAVPLAGVTAWQALFDHGRLRAQQRVLIHGAAGGVGHFAVQFARARGAHVIATAKAEDAERIRALGADEVIDYQTGRFEDEVNGVDLVVDLVGGDTLERSWKVLKDGGAVVSTLEEPSAEEARRRGARAVNFMAQPRREILAEIASLIDAGRVRVVLQKTYPLVDAGRAQDELEHEHSLGKRVLLVS